MYPPVTNTLLVIWGGASLCFFVLFFYSPLSCKGHVVVTNLSQDAAGRRRWRDTAQSGWERTLCGACRFLSMEIWRLSCAHVLAKGFF